MSFYIDLLNQIKERFSIDWLMPSQSKVYLEIHRFIGPPHKIINVYGKEGTGKTFLGWVLEKQGVGNYFESIDSIHKNIEVAIIDNVEHERDCVRGLRNTLRYKHIRQAIILTRYRAEDDIPSFELELNDDDLQFFKGNLFRYLNVKSPDGNSINLWKCLQKIVGA